MTHFEATLFKINGTTVLLLPRDVSATLPSRGMVLIEGTVNGHAFKYPLEPDGTGSHWLKIDDALPSAVKFKAGDTVTVEIEPSKDWPEPDLPDDLKSALAADGQFNALWMDTTPMARWDWIRWIQATNNPGTRANHIVVAFDKLKHGTRRPCCFNRSMCTDFSVSKNGVLLSQQQ